MKLLVTALFLFTSGTIVQCWAKYDKLFFLQRPKDNNGETFLVVTWSDEDSGEAFECEVFSDKDLIDKVMKIAPEKSVKKPSEAEMQNLIDDCPEISLQRKRRQVDESLEGPTGRRNFGKRISSVISKGEKTVDNVANIFRNNFGRKDEEGETNAFPGDMEETEDVSTATEAYNGWPVIWPGTKWCGAGDIAKSFDDLGFHQDTDRCCRAHDLCNDTLAPGETRNNLTNKSTFTKLNCQCDRDFYNCLDEVNTVISNSIGNLYFNVLKRECYEKNHPFSKKCKKYRTLFKITCEEFERDKKAPEVYQWIPAKRYKKIPLPGPLTVTLPF